ncbi:hypothetical protein RintRC_5381 [Richelia intracellularis]|nr:hypothetical protein RintRC_5381 [Richelia intracellularis]
MTASATVAELRMVATSLVITSAALNIMISPVIAIFYEVP